MNTTTNYEPVPQRSETAKVPPVLVRVPWLGARPGPIAAELARATERPLFDRALFEPHQLVAAADTDVTDFGTVRTHWRIDPPQDGPISPELHHRRPAITTTTIAPPSPAVLPPALPVRQVTTPASEGITHLRFDPPMTSAVEPSAQLSQSLPIADEEPSIWHQAVTALDVFLRRYQRVIMLVALIAAAGLMVLVLDNRGTAIESAPDGGAPTTIDSSDLTAMPLAEAMRDQAPAAIPERVAMAHGPRSSQREAVATTSDDAVAPIMLEPMAPQHEISSSITPIPTIEETDEGASYPTTGDPPFKLVFPHTTANESAEPGRARLSQEIQLAPQQIKQ